MAKKSKQKKNKYKDFQKVKLKVGKKLPKGQNETVATFKTRSVQIKEQLKTEVDDQQPTTRRKLNINDLLSQCKHYNSSVRQDAVMGIRELLAQNTLVLDKHVGSITERCSELLMDKDHTVRSNIHKMFRSFFSKISTSEMSAFFPMLSAHLCCAMTHIDESIQQDSLIVLDLCLEFFPFLVVQSSNKIMSNFIEQISRLTQTKGNVQRALLVNPNSKLSSQKWRNEVLQRLQKFFRSFIEYNYTSENHKLTVTSKEYFFCEGHQADVSLLKFANPISGSLQPFAIRDMLQQQKEAKDVGLQTFVEVLIPLLLQCWIEAGPSQLATDLIGNALSHSAMTTLWNILSVLQLLMDIVDKQIGSAFNAEWFTEKYLSDLVNYFLPYFPYMMHEQVPKSKGSGSKGPKSTGPQISVRTLNLAVCKVMSYFIGVSTNKMPSSKWQDKVLDYLIHTLPRTRLNAEQVTLVVGIIDKVTNFLQDEEIICGMLDLAHDVLICRQHTFSVDVMVLLKFFANFSFTKGNLINNRYPVLHKWVSCLPSLMWSALKPKTIRLEVVTELLYYMKSAGSFRSNDFITNLRNFLFTHVFAAENSPLYKLPVKQQKQLVELIYWLPKVSRPEYQALTTLCFTPSVNKAVIDHLLHVLNVRLNKSLESYETEGIKENTDIIQTDLCYYLSFMLTLILGKCDGEVPATSKQVQTPGLSVIIEKDSENTDIFSRRQYLIMSACKLVTCIPDHYQGTHIIGEFLDNYIKRQHITRKGIRLFTAIGLLHLMNEIMTPLQLDSEKDYCSETNTVNHTEQSNIFLHKLLKEDILYQVLTSLLTLSIALDSVIFESSETISSEQTGSKGGKGDHNTAEEEQMEVCEQTVDEGLSSDIKEALWSTCIDSLLCIPGLCKLYIEKTCNSLFGNGNQHWLECNTRVLTKLSSDKQILSMLSTEKKLLNQLVTEVELKQNKCESWWTDFKYEITLLK